MERFITLDGRNPVESGRNVAQVVQNPVESGRNIAQVVGNPVDDGTVHHPRRAESG